MFDSTIESKTSTLNNNKTLNQENSKFINLVWQDAKKKLIFKL
jgi:hypothetical protein